MKYKNIVMMLTLVVMVLCACNRDEIFEREQYKAVVAVKSEGSFNIYAQEHDLAGADANGFTEGFISANVGGSLATDQPITLSIAEDAALVKQYNQSSYGTESFRYARYLSNDRYSIASPVINIPAGERGGMMPIMIRAGGLSPDSIYFIPFRVDQCSAYELNLTKSTVLYRVYLQNFWSTTKSIPSYNHRGTKTQGDAGVPAPSFLAKSVYPVSGNEVRFFAGDKVYNAKENQELAIARWSVRVAIADDGKVTIRPWDTGPNGLKVTQVDDADEYYPNVFGLIDDGYGRIFKTFLLCYDYVDPNTEITYRMREELKIEHVITVN